MKKWFLTAAMAVLSMNAAMAQEVADAETVKDLMQYCVDVAAEDGTGDLSKQEFVLNCVNEELESEGYAKISALPKKV
ncbi:hypothetical protein [Aliiglaciecola lipolytica]|uniref:EF-hand domain-containing protein n=1 Tax=Aliiglaciecola lipolytica E3 TaxID=1127673 RepID=K6X7L0_9ALTE|nr:hypothetical protein [Aliiglaciecola lipolytica]GAC16614.1 hypothetical protein GLIP_4003 [Aliiglaciecola lipolytica E3]